MSKQSNKGRRGLQAFLLASLLLFGCSVSSTVVPPSSSPPKAPPAPPATAPERARPVPIRDVGGIVTSDGMKAHLLEEYRRWPQANGTISEIQLHGSLELRGQALLGMYNYVSKVLYLAMDQSLGSLIITLHHEVGHGLWAHYLPTSDRRWWSERYEQVRSIKGEFPSRYGATNAREFFAEHIAMAITYPEAHKRIFPIEHASMSVQRLHPLPEEGGDSYVKKPLTDWMDRSIVAAWQQRRSGVVPERSSVVVTGSVPLR